jgi:hypothetical protein
VLRTVRDPANAHEAALAGAGAPAEAAATAKPVASSAHVRMPPTRRAV